MQDTQNEFDDRLELYHTEMNEMLGYLEDLEHAMKDNKDINEMRELKQIAETAVNMQVEICETTAQELIDFNMEAEEQIKALMASAPLEIEAGAPDPLESYKKISAEGNSLLPLAIMPPEKKEGELEEVPEGEEAEEEHKEEVKEEKPVVQEPILSANPNKPPQQQ